MRAARRRVCGRRESWDFRCSPEDGSSLLAGFFRSTAGTPFADGLNLGGRNVEEFEKLLMVLRGGFFELRMPAVHVFVRETRGAHDGRPFLFRNHRDSPQLIRAFEQARDG